MSQFIIRGAELNDVDQVLGLAEQFSLLNLPADKRVLWKKIERSVESFAGERAKEEAEYLFLVEDRETGIVVASSLIIAKHGTEQHPHFYFDVIKRDHYSKDLGLGFIHQVLRLGIETNGPSEIGGLLVDKAYRRRPEKIGRQASLVRFQYMGIYPDRFENDVLCEFAPPLTDEGRSEFWEALGRRFTGLPYQEADMISQENKEFIQTLFPSGDIYLSLLDAKARLVVGRVSPETKGAQYMLQRLGFRYRDQVDPFDGGPHYGARLREMSLVKNTRSFVVSKFTKGIDFNKQGFVGMERDGRYRSIYVNFALQEENVLLPEKSFALLGVEAGESLWVSPYGE